MQLVSTNQTTMDMAANVMFPSQAIRLQFSYFFKMAMSPPFFFGLENLVPPSGTNAMASTILTKNVGDNKLEVYEILQPGEKISVPISQLAVLAGSQWTDDIYQTGLEMASRVNCYTDILDFPAALTLPDDIGDKVNPNGNEPCCIIDFTTTKATSVHYVSTAESITTWSITHLMKSNFVLSANKGSSFHRVPDVQALFLYAISFVVLAGLPAKIVGYVALNLLGKLSSVYRRLTTTAFSLENDIRNPTFAIWNATHHFHAATEGRDDISKAEIEDILRQALGARDKQSLDDDRINRIAQLCYDASNRAPKLGATTEVSKVESNGTDGEAKEAAKPRLRRMDLPSFVDSASSSQVITPALLDALFDSKRKRGFLERLFTPGRVAQYMFGKGTDQRSGKEVVPTSQATKKKRKSSHSKDQGDAADSATVNELLERMSMLEDQNDSLAERNQKLTKTVTDLREACLLCLEEMQKQKNAPASSSSGQVQASTEIAEPAAAVQDFAVYGDIESLRQMVHGLLTSQKALQAQQQSLQQLVQLKQATTIENTAAKVLSAGAASSSEVL